MKKKVLFATAFMLATVGAYAQGNGIAGITEATNKRMSNKSYRSKPLSI